VNIHNQIIGVIMAQANITIRATIVEALRGAPPMSVWDYKGWANEAQDRALAWCAREIERLEWAPKRSKMDLLRLAALRGANREIGRICAHSCPKAWAAWSHHYMEGAE